MYFLRILNGFAFVVIQLWWCKNKNFTTAHEINANERLIVQCVDSR